MTGWIIVGWVLLIGGYLSIFAAMTGLTGKRGGFGGAILLALIGGGILSGNDAFPSGAMQAAVFVPLAVLLVVGAILEARSKQRALTALSAGQLAGAALAAGGAPLVELRPVPFDVLLTYTDGRKQATQRTVTVQKLVGTEGPNGAIVLNSLSGWCNLARGTRTFRLDRISRMADPGTGEAIVDHAAYLLARAGHAGVPPILPAASVAPARAIVAAPD